jgi:anthranilate/para-aminobenzoate synthase component II
MKYLKRFVEGVGIVNVNGRHKQYRLKNLPHVGSPLDNGNSILQQDWFEKLLPDTLSVCSIPNIEKINKDLTLSKIDTSDKIYTLEKNDCTIDKDLVQFNYYQNTIKNPEDVVEDGEPDLLEFDIHFVKNTKGIKLLVDITYGDQMVFEFSIETPNKINIIHYTGFGSKYDPETHFGFTDDSINDLVKFFNAFNHGINLTKKDFSFLDQHKKSYKHDIHNSDHLYTDDSDLIEFENSVKESYETDIFLLINNAKDPEYKYFPKVAKYLNIRNIPFKVAYTSIDVEKYNSEYNIIGAISTGSDYSMKNPGNPSEYATNEKALEILKCPIIAMCYGFQSMAVFYGQSIIGGDLNCSQFNLTDYDQSHFLFQGIDLTQTKVSFCFHDFPVNVPSGFENIAMLGDIIAGISNSQSERYGILFHPEESQETYVILDNFVNHCEAKIIENDSLKLKTFESFCKKISK